VVVFATSSTSLSRAEGSGPTATCSEEFPVNHRAEELQLSRQQDMKAEATVLRPLLS